MNANGRGGIYFISRNIMHWFRSIKMIVTICYFLKSEKSVFRLVQCNRSLSKNYIAHSITVVCVIGWISAKITDLSALSGCQYIYNQSKNKDFSTNSHSTKRWLKHSSNTLDVAMCQSALHCDSALETDWKHYQFYQYILRYYATCLLLCIATVLFSSLLANVNSSSSDFGPIDGYIS